MFFAKIEVNFIFSQEIKRERPTFAPFRVPRKLQKDLPYRDKPKNRYYINKKKPKPERVAVIRDVEEAKVNIRN